MEALRQERQWRWMQGGLCGPIREWGPLAARGSPRPHRVWGTGETPRWPGVGVHGPAQGEGWQRGAAGTWHHPCEEPREHVLPQMPGNWLRAGLGFGSGLWPLLPSVISGAAGELKEDPAKVVLCGKWEISQGTRLQTGERKPLVYG